MQLDYIITECIMHVFLKLFSHTKLKKLRLIIGPYLTVQHCILSKLITVISSGISQQRTHRINSSSVELFVDTILLYHSIIRIIPIPRSA